MKKIPELWQKMMAAGWIHITGLPIYDIPRTIEQRGHDFVKIGQIFPADSYGCLITGVGRNNGKSVANLPDGSVWLRMGYEDPPYYEGMSANTNLGVPCSNGERLGDCWTTLLQRVSDPFYNGGPAKIREGDRLLDLAHMQYPATLDEVKAHPDFLCKHLKVLNKTAA